MYKSKSWNMKLALLFVITGLSIPFYSGTVLAQGGILCQGGSYPDGSVEKCSLQDNVPAIPPPPPASFNLTCPPNNVPYGNTVGATLSFMYNSDEHTRGNYYTAQDTINGTTYNFIDNQVNPPNQNSVYEYATITATETDTYHPAVTSTNPNPPPATTTTPAYNTCAVSNVSGSFYAVPITPPCTSQCSPPFSGEANSLIQDAQSWSLTPVTSTPPANHMVVYVPTTFSTTVKVGSVTGGCPTGWSGLGSPSWTCVDTYPYPLPGSNYFLNLTIVVTLQYNGTVWNFGDGGGWQGPILGLSPSNTSSETHTYQYITTQGRDKIQAYGVVGISATAYYCDVQGCYVNNFYNNTVDTPLATPEYTYVYQAEGI